MPRVTIVKGDNRVIIDGVGMPVDCSSLPAGLHAVQWDGTIGEVETVIGGRQVNTPISDLSPYRAYLDAWTAKKAEQDAAIAKAEADRQVYLASIDYLRALRDAKISALDWLVTRHRTQLDADTATSLTTDQYAGLCAYMQALRDITKTYSNAQSVVWPTAPAWLEG